jgi:hypothetical protein
MAILPQEEAAQIFTRLFESLARANNKTLKPQTRADIARACELLAQGGGDLDLLDDLLAATPPRATPGERATARLDHEEENVPHWRARLRNQGE